MYLKGRQFLLSHSGIQETLEEGGKENLTVNSLVFCDALSPDGEDSEIISLELKTLTKLAERFLKDYLERASKEELHSDTLVKAFEYAHEQLQRYAKHRSRQIAVSALALLSDPNSKTIFAACVGDCRLFRITSTEAEIVLLDQKNLLLDRRLTNRERFQRLNNALGRPDKLHVECSAWEDDTPQKYCALSYGAQGILSEEALHRLGHDPYSSEHGVASALAQETSTDTAIRICTFSHSQRLEGHGTDSCSAEVQDSTHQTRQNRRFLTIAVGAAVCAVTIPLLTLKLSPTTELPLTSQHHQLVELKEQTSRVYDLETKLAERSEEIHSLRHRLTAAIEEGDSALLGTLGKNLHPASNDTDSIITNLQEELAILRARGEAWHDREELLRSMADENADLMEQLARKDDSVAMLRQDLARASGLESAVLVRDQNLRSAEEEIDKIQRLLAKKEEKVTFLEQNLVLLDDMKRQLDGKEERLQRMAATHDQVVGELVDAQAQISFLNDSVALMSDLRETISQKEQQVAWLKAELSRMEEERAQGVSAGDKRVLDETIAKLRKTVAGLDEFIDTQSSAHDKELLSLNDELAQLYERCDELSHKQSQQHQALSNRENELNTLKNHTRELEYELSTARSTIADLQVQLIALEQSSQEQETLYLQLEALESELAEKDKLELGYQEASDQLEKLQYLRKQGNSDRMARESQIEELSQALADAEKEEGRWAEAYSALDQTLQAKQKQLSKLQGEREGLSLDYAHLDSMLKKSQGESAQLQAVVAEQDRLLEHFKQLRGDHGKDRDDLITRIEALNSDKNELQTLMRASDAELASVRSLYKHAQEALLENDQSELLSRLEHDIATVQAAYNEELSLNTDLRGRVKDQSRQIERLQSLSCEVETLREAFNDELERSRDLLFSAQKSQKTLKEAQSELAKLDGVKESFGELKHEHSRLLDSAARSELDLAETQQLVHKLQQHIEDLNSNYTALEAQVNASDKTLSRATNTEQRLRSEMAGLGEERDRFLALFESADEQLREEAQRREELSTQLQDELREKAALLQSSKQAAILAQQVAQLEEKYTAEHALRLQKEKRFALLAEKLHNQRTTLESIEEAKREAREELLRTRRSHAAATAPMSTQRTREIADIDPTLIPSLNAHRVSSGDTLTGISLKYYGTTARWSDIYEANREQMPSGDQVQIGMTLVIPE